MSNKLKTTEKHKGVVVKKIIFLIGLILVFNTAFARGEKEVNSQNTNFKSKEVRMDEIKAFVNGFETFAKKIIDSYWKEVKGIDAAKKAEKHHKMLSKIGKYFGAKDFNLQEWLLIQQEFDKRYEISQSEEDGFGSWGAYGMVRHYLEENLAQDLDILLAIASDKNYRAEVRMKYVDYLREILHEVLYYDGGKFKIDIDDKMKDKIVETLTINVNDRTNDVTLRKESAYLLAGYFGGNEKATDTIFNILNDPTENEEVKYRSIFGSGIKFGVAKDERIMKKLTIILKNRDNYSPNIFNRTMRTLSYLNNKDAINVGINILNTTDDESLFRQTVSSLCATNDKEAIKAVLKNNLKFRIKTTRFIVRNDDILISIMDNESEEYTLLAIEALGANLNKDPLNVVKQLEPKVYDVKTEIRLASMRAIIKIGERGDTDIETKNNILSILNKAKSIEKDNEVLSEIKNSIKILEGRP